MSSGDLMLYGLVLLGLFLLFRWVNNWYWRINEMVGLLRRIDARLAEIGGAEKAGLAVAQQQAQALEAMARQASQESQQTSPTAPGP